MGDVQTDYHLDGMRARSEAQGVVIEAMHEAATHWPNSSTTGCRPAAATYGEGQESSTYCASAAYRVWRLTARSRATAAFGTPLETFSRASSTCSGVRARARPL